MTDHSVSDYDMPEFAWSTWSAASGFQDADLAALLAGAALPAEAPAPLQHVADVVAALRAEPAAEEMVGEAVALAEFWRRVGVSRQPHRFRIRRPAMLSPLLSATAVAAVCLGGFAVAGYARALPPPAQQLAHETILAPADHDAGTQNVHHSSKPAGPDASRSPGSDRCTSRSSGTERGYARQPTSGDAGRVAARPGSCVDARPSGGGNFASDHSSSGPDQSRQSFWTDQPSSWTEQPSSHP